MALNDTFDFEEILFEQEAERKAQKPNTNDDNDQDEDFDTHDEDSDNNDTSNDDNDDNDDIDLDYDEKEEAKKVKQQREEEKQEEKQKKNTAEEDVDDEEERTQVTQYYDFLKKTSVLKTSSDFKFDGTIESLEEALEQTKKTIKEEAQESFFERLPPEFKYALNYVASGGTSLLEFAQSLQPINYAELDLDDIETQRAVMRDYYRSTSNYTDTKINKLVALLEANGDLEQESADSIIELQELQKTKLARIEEEEENKRKEQEKKVKEQTELLISTIDNVPNTEEKRKNRLKAFMLTPASRGDSNTQFSATLSNIFSNPAHLIELADLLADYEPRIGFNYTRLKGKLKTEVNKGLKTILQETSKNRPTSTQSRSTQKEDFDWNKFINS